MKINDDSYVELLAMLCRKGFGETRIRHEPSDGAKVTTIAEEYETEERRELKTRGEYRSEPHDGKLAIVRVDCEAPLRMWLEVDAPAAAPPAIYYIVGEEGVLGCTSTPPKVRRDHRDPKRQAMLWLASATVGRFEFRIVRGHAEEYRTYDGTHTRVIARELPADAVPELERLNQAVTDAEAALQRAKQDRRDFLSAQVPRAILARVPAPHEA